MGAACRSCGAPVVWALTESGKPMPMDAEPIATGNFILSHRRVGDAPVAVHQGMEDIERLAALHDHSPQEGPLRLFVSHFATCPNAAAHRRSRSMASTVRPASPETPGGASRPHHPKQVD